MLTKRKMLLVIWNDAASSDPWRDQGNLLTVSVIETMGFLVKEDDAALYLCGDWDDNTNTSRRITIPKVCIVKRKVLNGRKKT